MDQFRAGFMGESSESGFTGFGIFSGLGIKEFTKDNHVKYL